MLVTQIYLLPQWLALWIFSILFNPSAYFITPIIISILSSSYLGNFILQNLITFLIHLPHCHKSSFKLLIWLYWQLLFIFFFFFSDFRHRYGQLQAGSTCLPYMSLTVALHFCFLLVTYFLLWNFFLNGPLEDAC